MNFLAEESERRRKDEVSGLHYSQSSVESAQFCLKYACMMVKT
jgi:hypothetical protein